MLGKISLKNNEDIKGIESKYKLAVESGIVVKDKLQNPNEEELSYYQDVLGSDFKHSPYFVRQALLKWVPALKEELRIKLSEAIFDALEELRLSGKNESVLKNVYIKYMCWMYYHFRKAVYSLQAGKKTVIIGSSKLGKHEIMWLEALGKVGAEVLLFEDFSQIGVLEENFKKHQIQEQKERRYSQIFKGKTQITAYTNKSVKGDFFKAIKTPHKLRNSETNGFTNVFCKINGADDASTYEESLYEFYREIVDLGRKIVVVNKEIPIPSSEEISKIKRKDSYISREDMIFDLLKNIVFRRNQDVEVLMKKAFLDLFFFEAKRLDISDAKLKSKMVYILCWLARYEKDMFSGFDFSELPLFIKLCVKTKTEALFLRFLACLPADVIIFKPDLLVEDLISDKRLKEVCFEESLKLEAFPTQINHRTAAYKAERQLDEIMYKGSGLYRSRQYTKAESIVINTMFEEIELLWNEAPRFRQGFCDDGEKLIIPTIFAKLSGVPQGDENQYWKKFSKLIVEDCILVKELPFIRPFADNPIKSHIVEFYKNGKVDRTKIKEHRFYKYRILREETQEHIFDKMEQLIERRLINGIGTNGSEYAVISTILNLPKEVVRLIQKFDFTKENPKFIYVNLGEKIISLEDSIVCLFLNLVGFDVLFMVPTGYQSIEKYFPKDFICEHQIGEYVYDMQVPNYMGNIKNEKEYGKSWKTIFRLRS